MALDTIPSIVVQQQVLIKRTEIYPLFTFVFVNRDVKDELWYNHLSKNDKDILVMYNVRSAGDSKFLCNGLSFDNRCIGYRYSLFAITEAPCEFVKVVDTAINNYVSWSKSKGVESGSLILDSLKCDVFDYISEMLSEKKEHIPTNKIYLENYNK